MGLKIEALKLISRVVRKNISQGKTGTAVFNNVGLSAGENLARRLGKLTKFQKDQSPIDAIVNSPIGKFIGGLVNNDLTRWAWNSFDRFTDWIAQGIMDFLGFSITEIVEIIKSNAVKLFQFDWNQTDEQLLAASKNRDLALATLYGSTVGQSVGWLAGVAVGAGVSFAIPVIGGARLAAYIAGKTAKEAIEELIPVYRNLLLTTFSSKFQNALTEFYINFRWYLKGMDFDTLRGIFGDEAAYFIDHVWGKGTEGGLGLSIQAWWIQEPLARVKDDWWKNFLEALLEEAWDSFVEAGFVIAGELDNILQQQKLGTQQSLGKRRTVEITLDKTAKGATAEKLYFQDVPQKQLIPIVQQTINTHRLIHNRDIGLVMGLPVEEYTRIKPQSLQLVIDLYSVQKPPFFRNKTDGFVWATITIPDCKTSALDWDKIKLALGGKNGYLWGRFRAIGRLTTNRKMIVYGGTAKEAEDRLKALLPFTTGDLQSLTVTEEKKEGVRATRKGLSKEPTRVYPGFFTVINWEETTDLSKGRANTKGQYREKKAKIPLWTDRAPANTQALISSILRKGG